MEALGFDGRRMARTNFALLPPRARYPLHFPEYRERQDTRIQETRTWREGSDPPPPACVRTRTLEPSFIHAKCAADVYTVRMMISVSRKLVA